MALRQIRLELARNADYPEGSASHGYSVVAPLTDDGHLDPDGWEYVSITEHDGVQRTFRVAEVVPFEA